MSNPEGVKSPTLKQEQAYEAMIRLVEKNHGMPTMSELSIELGLSSPNAAQERVDGLVKRGWLICAFGKHRGHMFANHRVVVLPL